MKLDRRTFLLLTLGLAAGCENPNAAGPGSGLEREVDAGPAVAGAADGVDRRFRSRGFFLVRRGGRWLAISSVCTHRKCRLEAEADGTFTCPCHGSTFDPEGHVTQGPARRDLKLYPVTVDDRGRLRVTVRE